MRWLGHRPLTSLPDIYATGPGGDPPARHLPLPTARRTAASLSPLSTCCATNFALECCGPSPPRLRVSRNYRMWTRKTAVVSWTMTARSSQDRGESTCLFSRTFAPSRVRKRQWKMVWRTRRPECLFARSARPAGQRTRSLGAAQPSNSPLLHLVAPFLDVRISSRLRSLERGLCSLRLLRADAGVAVCARSQQCSRLDVVNSTGRIKNGI